MQQNSRLRSQMRTSEAIQNLRSATKLKLGKQGITLHHAGELISAELLRLCEIILSLVLPDSTI